MTPPDPVQLRQWTEELTRDPGSLAFFPLAGAYREQGRSEAALRLCLRGLERHPEHVEGHVLLGLLYRDRNALTKAFDEWDIALRLDPDHPGARRAIGLLCAERGEWERAERHLAALPESERDREVHDALARIRRQLPGGGETGPDSPSLISEIRAAAREEGVVGAVLLDAHGCVVAGEVGVGGRDRAPELAAALRGASDDARRATTHLQMGAWRSILLETPEAVLHLSPVEDSLLAVAGERSVPTGWLVRAAKRLLQRAAPLLGRSGGGEAP